MPTYDYKCENCNFAFELFHSMKDEPVRVCPSCGEEAVQRLIGAGAGLVFKGSGFYLTDYVRNGNGKPQTSVASKESSSSDSNTESSSGSGGTEDRSTGSSGDASSGKTDGGANTKNEGSSGEGGSSKSTASKGASSTDSAPSSSSKAA